MIKDKKNGFYTRLKNVNSYTDTDTLLGLRDEYDVVMRDFAVIDEAISKEEDNHANTIEKQLRIGMTISALAVITGFHKSTVSRWSDKCELRCQRAMMRELAELKKRLDMYIKMRCGK